MKSLYNTESYTVEKKKHRLTDYAKQKLLGFALVVLGLIFCIVIPEDATAGLFLVILGTARMLVD